jgi:hypothetical protein
MPTAAEKQQFYREVEAIAISKELDWLDAIMEYCKITGMEIEVASSLINAKLKKQLAEVAHKRNYLKKTKGEKLNV